MPPATTSASQDPFPLPVGGSGLSSRATLAPPHPRRMTPDLDRLLALGEARSCLAALADTVDDDVAASHFERLLIALDVLQPDGPASWPIDGEPTVLLARLAQAADRLVELGADPAPLDLIVSVAHMPLRPI